MRTGFIDRTDRVLALLDGFMPEAAWLSDEETLTYLHSTVSTRRHSVRVPETPMHLDAILVDEPLSGGLEPRLGNAHLRTLTVLGLTPHDAQRCGWPAYRASGAACGFAGETLWPVSSEVEALAPRLTQA